MSDTFLFPECAPGAGNNGRTSESSYSILPPSRRNAPATSRLAAQSMLHASGMLRARVHDFIRSCGALGATDRETQAALGLSSDTEVPRRWELEKRGEVVRTNRRRPTPSGRSAGVYVAREFAAIGEGVSR